MDGYGMDDFNDFINSLQNISRLPQAFRIIISRLCWSIPYLFNNVCRRRSKVIGHLINTLHNQYTSQNIYNTIHVYEKSYHLKFLAFTPFTYVAQTLFMFRW